MIEFFEGQPVRIKGTDDSKLLASNLAASDDRFVGMFGVVVGNMGKKSKPLIKVLLESGQKIGFFDWELEPIN